MQQQQFFLRSYNCDKEIFLLDLQQYQSKKQNYEQDLFFNSSIHV